MVNKYVGFGKKLFDFAAKRGEKSNMVSTIVGETLDPPTPNNSKSFLRIIFCLRF